uniref:DM domain-containing protein n=1 Tax=Meloidogyne floridensis TaxID=298350 RepID=A0A915NJD8_9BILA
MRLEHARKGHKLYCRYQDCQCAECQMVIKRRRLNKALNSRRHGKGKFKLIKKPSGSKLRNPTCARCSAHGKESTLRGHKKFIVKDTQHESLHEVRHEETVSSSSRVK